MKQEQNTENNVTFVFTCFKGQKINYCNDLDLSKVADNRKFQKTIIPSFTNKIKIKNKASPDEYLQSIKDDQKVANIFNSFFVKTAFNLKISYNKSLSQNDQFSFKSITKEMIAK